MSRKLRKIRICGEIAYVPLTKGYEAVIDAADIPLIAGRNWCAKVYPRTVYAQRGTMNAKRESVSFLMHRVLISAPDGMQVDHIDGDGLNNRRSNLRLATHSQNGKNQKTPSNNTSGIKGVKWDKERKKWYASIKIEKKSKFIGRFNRIDEAQQAYREAALELFGEFASKS